MLGRCIRCGGKVAFASDAELPDGEPVDPKLGPHQVLGSPRLEL